ncbi:AAA family ATPase [Priestia aryabhattai]|uniref:AAA family ATPase n=1 Tax=Priestia aryabhattai TaxID=412384 RepID=UPI001C8DCB48|nr:ATP-binding protein [Priestia aryabhattai]MBX9967218.1 AAA family ATPase [Priestia aryabhattai]
MKIKTLNIKRYQMLKDLKFSLPSTSDKYFSNMNLTILVGENGTGKTSILKFISEIFFKTTEENWNLENYITFDMGNDTYYKDKWSNEKTPSKIIVSTFSPYEQFKKFRSNKFSFIGASSSSKISRLFYSIVNQMSSSDFKKKAALQNLISEVGYVNPPLLEIDTKIFTDNYIEEAGYNKKQILEKLRTHFFQNRVLIKGKELLHITQLANYDGGTSKWLKDLKTLKIFDNYRILNLWFPKDDDFIPITSFSSGELTLFYRFFLLIDVITDNSVVLIDEPEIHLHPKWIKKYTKLLRDVFSEFKTHIIIATHSPLIASDLPKDCIMGLKFNENNNAINYLIKEQTLGSNHREILREVFKVENYFGEFTMDIRDRIEKHIKDNNVEQALRYYDDLGDSELKFELFLKLEELLDKQGEE